MIKNSLHTTSFWCFSLLLFLSISAFAYEPTPDQKHKASVTQVVYKNIVEAIGDGRQAPELIFAFNKTTLENHITYYSPRRHTIIIGEGIYNITTTFGTDSLNALAFVLGHELAHFYKDHGWGMAFGSASEDLEIAKEIYVAELSIDRKKIMESEADYFGSLFGYMAGYNTLAVGGKFIAAFYEIGVPEELPGYPNKSDRIKMVEEVAHNLAPLLPVFEAANLLSIIGDYEESGRCYEHIATSFPSREIYNNAGVNLSQHALSLVKQEELDFYYPFGMDEATRLNASGSKGGDPSALKKELLQDALKAFEKSIHLDKTYLPAYINTALAYDLLGDHEMAQLMALKANRLAAVNEDSVLMANALITKGIIQAHLNLKKEAKSSFNAASVGNKKIAALNLAVLKSGKPYTELIAKKQPTEILTSTTEAINEVDPSLIEVLLPDAKKTELKSQHKARPKVKIYAYEEDGIKAIYIKHYSNPIKERAFIFTPHSFDGASSRGIELGDDQKKVLKAYGAPSQITSSLNGTYFIYKQTGIIFKMDQFDAVSSWILY